MTASTQAPDASGRWSTRGHRIAGLVLAGYLIFTLVELAVLRRDPSAFNRWVELRGSLLLRLVAWAVMVMLVFHGLNGLRIVALELSHATARAGVVTGRLVAFATAVSVIPLAVLALRPYAEGWWP